MPVYFDNQVIWIVDVQNDFMNPPEKGGRLYVRDLTNPEDVGATTLRGKLGEMVAKWRQKNIPMVFTGDWHKDDDPEIDAVSPNFINTFPPHCMGASNDPSLQSGAALIKEVSPANPLILGRDPKPGEGDIMADEMIQTGRPLFVQKHRFSVFEGNSEAAGLIEGLRRGLDEPEFIVCGVATDVCVKQAVDGLLEHGAKVTVVSDLVWGLGQVEPEDLFKSWQKKGARIIKSQELSRKAPLKIK